MQCQSIWVCLAFLHNKIQDRALSRFQPWACRQPCWSHKIIAWARPTPSGPTVPSHTDKSIFEEACPSCFHLQVLDKSGMCLAPKPKLTPEILVSGEAKSTHSVFKKQKFFLRGTKSPKPFFDDISSVHQNSKHYGQRKSFLSAMRNNSTTTKMKPRQQTPESPVLSCQVWFQRWEPSFCFQNAYLDSHHSFAPQRRWAKQRNTYLN